MWCTRVLRLSTSCFGQSRLSHIKPLEGKVAILTGATNGIGLAAAQRLCEDGAHVVVSSRKEENVERAVKMIRDADPSHSVSGVVFHAGAHEELTDCRIGLIDDTVSQFGGLDIIIAVAGVNPGFGPILDSTRSKWDKLMSVNVIGPFLLAKEAIPHMRKRGGGNVIFTSTISATSYMPGLGVYGISKSCLPTLAKMMAYECGKDNIRVNCVEPALIPTDFSKVLWKDSYRVDDVIKRTPLARLGTVEDYASAIAFLVSEDAKFITGQTLRVNGGADYYCW